MCNILLLLFFIIRKTTSYINRLADYDWILVSHLLIHIQISWQIDSNKKMHQMCRNRTTFPRVFWITCEQPADGQSKGCMLLKTKELINLKFCMKGTIQLVIIHSFTALGGIKFEKIVNKWLEELLNHKLWASTALLEKS